VGLRARYKSYILTLVADARTPMPVKDTASQMKTSLMLNSPAFIISIKFDDSLTVANRGGEPPSNGRSANGVFGQD
jgi:hypothetical protein